MVIRCSSVSTVTRIDWPAALAGSSSLTAASTGSGLTGFAAGASTGTGLAAFAAGRSTAVSRNTRSSSSSETSPGRNGRSSTCGVSVPTAYWGVAGAADGASRSTMRSRSEIRSSSPPSGSRCSRSRLMRSMVERMSVTASLGRRQAVAKFAHQRLGGMRERFQPWQPQEAAGALDGVHETEDVIEDLGVVRVLLESHGLDVDHVETLGGLGHEFPQQIVHEKRLRRQALARPPLSVGSAVSVSMKRLILVAEQPNSCVD